MKLCVWTWDVCHRRQCLGFRCRPWLRHQVGFIAMTYDGGIEVVGQRATMGGRNGSDSLGKLWRGYRHMQRLSAETQRRGDLAHISLVQVGVPRTANNHALAIGAAVQRRHGTRRRGYGVPSWRTDMRWAGARARHGNLNLSRPLSLGKLCIGYTVEIIRLSNVIFSHSANKVLYCPYIIVDYTSVFLGVNVSLLASRIFKDYRQPSS